MAVPRKDEYISIGSLNGDKLQRFEVQRVLHFHLDSGKIDPRELIGS
jgi:hypothetical protein